jgi:hypothetical protein
MKFLIVAALHHPEELAKLQQKNSSETFNPFPPSQGLFFWVRSLRKLGHEVDAYFRNVPAVFGWRSRQLEKFTGTRNLSMLITALSYRLPRAHPDYWLRNRRLIQAVAQSQPDAILLIGDNREIFPETLETIKTNYGCKIIYLSGVSPIVFSAAIERQAAPLYDLVLVSDFYHGIQWLELGSPCMEVLPLSACDPEYHRSYELSAAEQKEYGCDVGFVGTLLPPRLYGTRIKAMEAVRNFDLGIWSVHGMPPSLAQYYRGPALGEKMLRILRGSKVQINSHGNFVRWGGNMRLFEAAGCGVFQIADDLPGIANWFEIGKHIVTYRDFDDLCLKTHYYLEHEDERREIAQAAQAHVYANHTYDHRMARLVNLIEALPG